MTTIFSLPVEINTYILNILPYPDIIRFGSTCKKFNELVKSNQMLWKSIYKNTVHPDIMEQKLGSPTNWLEMMKKYFILKQTITTYLEEMSSVHYNNYNPVNINDVKHFFLIALADESSLGESIYILQQFIRQGNSYLNTNYLKKPYSLTTVYYAKIVIRNLFQMYLAFIWGMKHIVYQQSPVNVINFFVQWVDPLNIHPLEEVIESLEILINIVKQEILNRYPAKVKTDPKLENPQTLLCLTDNEIVNAISSVIYEQRYITLMPNTTLSTLDIVQVIQKRCGCVVAVGAIYQYIADRFGLKCNLIVFANHFILELNKRDDDNQVYKISLDTGICQPKGNCPFSRSFCPGKQYTYCPLSLIQYTGNEYISSVEGVRDWYSFNVENILDMVNREKGEHHFINLWNHLESHNPPEEDYKINYFKMKPDQLELFRGFLVLDNPRRLRKRGVIINTRPHDLKFAIGMICYHLQYHYVCLVTDWDTSCFNTRVNQNEVRTLQFGLKQPFYHVIAMDQSKRYVPQENLVEYHRPPRLYHLEDAIAKGFSHFNGFAYVPNDEKSKEYPEDTTVSDFFKSQYEVQNGLE